MFCYKNARGVKLFFVDHFVSFEGMACLFKFCFVLLEE